MRQELVDRLVPGDIPSIEEIEKKYPKRDEKLVVTRMAPSPTGFMHIGTVYTAMIAERLAHQNNGVFFLRIEDTDSKREVDGAVDAILKTFDYCHLNNDEGLKIDGVEYGNYGPYTQSQRRNIYKAYVKEFLKRDLAYPSFMTQEELDKMREEQQKLKIRTGLYGLWAKERNLTEEQIINNLNAGKPYVINFKSSGSFNDRVVVEDLVKGKKMLPDNDLDIVILKSDGLPTYHFAHLVDDHLMGTTHVVRTDEWFISTPLHLQLFKAIGWKAPFYMHPAPVQKMEDGAKRKLSKRKDPEANFMYYIEKGYPKEVILDYLMNLLNSNYEDWKKQNPKADLKDFNFNIKMLGTSGALLDFKKLDSMCKDFMATLSADELYDRLYEWANKFDSNLAKSMKDNKDYFIRIFEIERKNCDRVRKDYGSLSTVYDEIKYFFEYEYSLKQLKKDMPNLDISKVKEIVADYIGSYDENFSKDEWFNNLKTMASKYNYAANNKEFNPEIHVGNISDFVAIFRYLITTKKNSPDLYSIMQVLGRDEVLKRLTTIED